MYEMPVFNVTCIFIASHHGSANAVNLKASIHSGRKQLIVVETFVASVSESYLFLAIPTHDVCLGVEQRL